MWNNEYICSCLCFETRIFQNVKLLEISSIHDGHDQTKLVLCLESVRQWHNEATVNLLKNPLLHHCPLQEKLRKTILKNNALKGEKGLSLHVGEEKCGVCVRKQVEAF